ncbi:MAG: lamin tail domain-containing protein [Candidatus Andersenbacteria bacterium]
MFRYGPSAVFLLLVVFAPAVRAAGTGPVIINEIMWDGVEYLELFNITTADIVLAGWSLQRQQPGGVPKTIVNFPAGSVISAQGYYLIEKQEAATLAAADLVVPGLTLLNAGELVTLLQAEGSTVDVANQLGSWFAGENNDTGTAMERSRAADGTVADNWHTSTASGERGGTPRASNSIPVVNTAPTAVITAAATGFVGESLNFSAEDSSDPEADELTYDWSWDDGTTDTGATVMHVFSQAGTYTIRLTVSDGTEEDEAVQNVVITTPVYPDTIVINEFLPNPVGADTAGEFIELKNIGSAAVVLAGWQLDDAVGGSSTFTIGAGTSLGAGAIISLARTETNLALNNTQDTVRLLDPAGVVKSSFTYTSAPEGQSYNHTGVTYSLSTTVTPGQENRVTVPVESDDEEEAEEAEDGDNPAVAGRVAGAAVKTVALADVREEEPGTLVQTEGVVSAPPGIVGAKLLYLAGSGIQVYFTAGDVLALKLGDRVKLTGSLSSYQEETRLKVAGTDITKVHSGEPPLPHQFETGAIDEAAEGSLVIIQGHVTETSGDTFYVDDGSGEVKIFIPKTTKIDKPPMKQGMAVTITGVVSQTRSGYRILPRFQEDIRLGLVAGLTTFPATGRIPAGMLGLGVVIFYLLQQAQRAREPLLPRSRIA